MSDCAQPLEYNKCEYALFISYAYSDDKGHNGWVGALRDAIWDRLHGMPGDITRRDIYFSKDNGASAGHLGYELRETLKSSFAMLLVVGKRYVDSHWCEKELQIFKDVFGTEATKSRLYVAVMSQNALEKVRKGELWQEVVAPDQVWVAMYREKTPGEPIPAKTDSGEISQTMYEHAKKIADSLAEQIERSVDREKLFSPPTAMPAIAIMPAVAIMPGSAEQLRVLIGPCTSNLTARAATLAEALQRSGAQVSVLDRSVIDNWDPDAEFPLGREFALAHTMVVPFSEAKPLKPDWVGGHITVLRDEWDKLKKSRDIVWYRPADLSVGEGDRALPKHIEVFSRLAPVYASERTVVDHLFSTGNALRVYIEKHPHQPAYGLGPELDKAWEELPAEPGKPARLEFAYIELGALESVPSDDAAGFVLLMPEPATGALKGPSALYSQIKTVKDTFPRKGWYPGIVARIFDLPPSRHTGLVHDWGEIHLYRIPQEAGKFVVDDDSREWLKGFVRLIWDQYKLSGKDRPIH